MAEVARRLDVKLSTLASELNPKATNAKFGIDGFEELCKVVREIGYGKELDGILHEYFEEIKHYRIESESTDNLTDLAMSLMSNTAALADGTTKLMKSADDAQLRKVKEMIRSELIPTAMRLDYLIDRHLNETSSSDEPYPQVT
jgi:hypothetical protein